jgi:hypothetical protein
MPGITVMLCYQPQVLSSMYVRVEGAVGGPLGGGGALPPSVGDTYGMCVFIGAALPCMPLALPVRNDSVHSMCLAWHCLAVHANSILNHANALQGTRWGHLVANAAVPQLARCHVRQATAGSGSAVLGLLDCSLTVNSGTVTNRTSDLRHCFCAELIVQCQAGIYCCGVVVRAQAGCMLACLHSSVLSASATCTTHVNLADWQNGCWLVSGQGKTCGWYHL